MNTLPSRYADLDYLDPILFELKPPILTVPLELYVDTDTAKQWDEEFNNIVTPAYDTYLVHHVLELGETASYLKSVKSFYRSQYLSIKTFKYGRGIRRAKELCQY